MRILIVGGTGLTGRAMASRLRRSGHELVLISRTGGDGPGQHVQVDRNSSEAFRTALQQLRPDVVIDQIAYCGKHVDDVATCAPARHIVCSTAAVLGSGLDLSEDAPTVTAETDFLAGKLELEHRAKFHGATVLRPAYLYGPAHAPLTLDGRDDQLIDRLRAGEPVELPDDGPLPLQPVFAADYAAAVEAILNLDQPAPLYHVGGLATTWHGWFEALAAAVQVPLRVSLVRSSELAARSFWYRDYLRHPLTITSTHLPEIEWTPLTVGAASLVAGC